MLKIYESGAAIPNCQPIRGDIAKEIALKIIEDLKNNFKTNAIALGSTIKKDENSYCGDLDIAIELPWESHEKVLGFCSGRYGLDYKHINNSLHVCAFGYVFDEDGERKIAQVDIMFVDNIEWALELQGIFGTTTILCIVSNSGITYSKASFFDLVAPYYFLCLVAHLSDKL